MTTIVIGGHSRNVGKTSVAAGLIAAFSRYPWTAIKISPHEHSGISQTAPDELYEEQDSEGPSDTSRFLAAGASRALWMRVGSHNAETAVQRLLPIIKSNPFVLIESNRVLAFIDPDLYFLVLRYDIEEFKESARETLGRADALIGVGSCSLRPAWKGVSLERMRGIPLFKTSDPQCLPKGFVDFVQSRLPVIHSS
jgi:hypothetical protein